MTTPWPYHRLVWASAPQLPGELPAGLEGVGGPDRVAVVDLDRQSRLHGGVGSGEIEGVDIS